MATITVKIEKKGLQQKSVEKFVAGATNYQWANDLAKKILFSKFSPDLVTEEEIKKVEKTIWEFAPYLPEGVRTSVSVYNPPESRADRLAEAEAKVQDAVSDVNDLKSELEDWRDNLPEQFEEKRDQLDDAISNLESIADDLENVDFSSVEFPGAFGS